MLKETIELERLRQQIEDADYEAGSQSDYLDRGRPNPAQQKQAEKTIASLTSRSQQLKSQLHEKIVTIRQNNPDAIAEWVKTHQGILARVAAEQTTGVNASIRRDMARETSDAWDKVLAGEQEYISINWYFLKDYKEEVRKTFKNSWWQFWK